MVLWFYLQATQKECELSLGVRLNIQIKQDSPHMGTMETLHTQALELHLYYPLLETM